MENVRRAPEIIHFVLDGETIDVAYRPGDTLLESAQRVGVDLPHSCRIGSCATCIGRVTMGEVAMLENHVLSEKEVKEGYVLVCQGIPLHGNVTIAYEDG